MNDTKFSFIELVKLIIERPILGMNPSSLRFVKHIVGAGPRSYRKSCYIGTRKSKRTVPERPRRESSPTALKAAAEKRELNHCT